MVLTLASSTSMLLLKEARSSHTEGASIDLSGADSKEYKPDHSMIL
jgi:hypothetical protein